MPKYFKKQFEDKGGSSRWNLNSHLSHISVKKTLQGISSLLNLLGCCVTWNRSFGKPTLKHRHGCVSCRHLTPLFLLLCEGEQAVHWHQPTGGASIDSEETDPPGGQTLVPGPSSACRRPFFFRWFPSALVLPLGNALSSQWWTL